MVQPAITIVVMGYRNERTILAAVASVTSQVAPEAYEVVVVTSGGDRSAQLIRAVFDRIEVAEVVESPVRLLPGGARNAGTTAARGAIVAFLAADCLAEPGWVAARLAAHRGGHPVVAGAMTAAVPSRPSAWASHYTLFCHRLPGRRAGPVTHADPAAHSLSFERSVLDRLGPFDPDVRVGEDTEAARRLGDLGIGVWFEPAVRTAHRGPRNAWAMVRDHHRRGITAARAAGPALRPLSALRAPVAYLVSVVLVSRSFVQIAWRYGRGERLRLVLSFPWLVAAVAASLAGRYRERLRRGR